MGHSSTKTTETYYGRMRAEKALADINAAWSDGPEAARAEIVKKSAPEAPVYQNSLIDKKFPPPGYG